MQADKKKNPPSRSRSLHEAAKNGDIKALRWHLEQGVDIDQKDDGGNTALLLAAKNGHLKAVKWLYEKGANIDESNNEGDTALLLAAFEGNWDVLDYLYEKGANIDESNNEGDTALLLAAVEGNWDAVGDLYEKGANIDESNNQGDTAFSLATDEGDPGVLIYLLSLCEKEATLGESDRLDTTLLRALEAQWPAEQEEQQKNSKKKLLRNYAIQEKGHYEYYFKATKSLDVLYISKEKSNHSLIIRADNHLKLKMFENKNREALETIGNLDEGKNTVVADISFIVAPEERNQYGKKQRIKFPVRAITGMEIAHGQRMTEKERRKYRNRCDVCEVYGIFHDGESSGTTKEMKPTIEEILDRETPYEDNVLSMLEAAELKMKSALKNNGKFQKAFKPSHERDLFNPSSFFHSESALFHLLYTEKYIKGLIEKLKTKIKIKFPGQTVRIYAIVLDIHTTRPPCHECAQLAFGVQNDLSEKGFLKQISEMLIKDKQLTLTKRTTSQEKLLRMLIRFSSTISVKEYDRRKEPKEADLINTESFCDKDQLFNNMLIYRDMSSETATSNAYLKKSKKNRHTLFTSGRTETQSRKLRHHEHIDKISSRNTH